MRHNYPLPACGVTFKGRQLSSRLDSGKKTYRQVYKSDETEEVIIVYALSETPEYMKSKSSRLPIEYEFFQVFGDKDISGLPKLIDAGFDNVYAWIVTQYIDLTRLSSFCSSKSLHSCRDENTINELIAAASASFNSAEIFQQTDYRLFFAPDNICFDDESREVRLVVVGLDTALFPMYQVERAPSFVDVRYFSPELLHNRYSRKSASYSLALCLLSAIRGAFPFAVQNTGGIIPATLTVKAVTEHACNSPLDLPVEFEKVFRDMLKESPKKRLLLGTNESIKKIDQEEASTLPKGLDDVAGHEDFKKEIEELEYIISFPNKAKRLGIKLPNYLLVGPPGTGKTFFAQKACEQLGIPTITVSVADMEGSYYGESSQKIEQVFLRAKRMAEENADNLSANRHKNSMMIPPVAIIIDELEAVGQKRNSDLSPGAVSTTSTLLQFIEKSEEYHAIVFSTSNNLSNIESSVYRNGRFVRKYFGFPDDGEKEAVLRCVLRRRNSAIQDDDYPKLVAGMAQFVQGDIEEAAKTAAKMALKESGRQIIDRFIEKNPGGDKLREGYQEFVNNTDSQIGHTSFIRWCKTEHNQKLLQQYLDYCQEWDTADESTPIDFSMMSRAIEMTMPSSTKAQVREYESIYQDFLPDAKRKQRTIGF